MAELAFLGEKGKKVFASPSDFDCINTVVIIIVTKLLSRLPAG
jgi:hypothetical protein